MQRLWQWWLLGVLGLGLWLANSGLPEFPPAGQAPPVATEGAVSAPDSRPAHRRRAGAEARSTLGLPPEARRTIALIQAGGPFPHRQDGAVFGNREGRLPRQARGWYREYTVDTPGLGHRGARRIVTGGSPPVQWYYTDDHYDSFLRFDPSGSGP